MDKKTDENRASMVLSSQANSVEDRDTDRATDIENRSFGLEDRQTY